MGELLSKINRTGDVKQLDNDQLPALCEEIREVLIETVSHNGGHLASNLGVVELTVALHRVFDFPNDSLLFDVGHQSYTHKLLTGRRDRFGTLRQKDGIAGFPKPGESDCDPFIAGHSSTSLSNAIGLARAKQLKGDASKVVAVLGDGAFANGMVYEAINNIDSSMKNLIVVLNDNSMSISKSVGSISGYLLRLRTATGYSRFKEFVQRVLEKTPLIGNWIARTLLKSKSFIRRHLYGGTLFEELGFNYVGTVDGHNVAELCRIMDNIRQIDGPILLHAITVKGKGFALAEENPGAYHGVGQFDLEAGNPDISQADSFSNVFGRKLCRLADNDLRICAVTAAMKYATGLHYFYKHHSDRFFDVGIAEEHAVTFCAGLARGGMKPVFGVYSTFLQRAFDQLVHDVSLSRVDLMLAIDRAGLVGDDGETHQGLLDAAMLNTIGGFTVAAPANYGELEYWTEQLVGQTGPRAIRYPRGNEDERLATRVCTGEPYDLLRMHDDADCLFITYGREFAEVLEAAQILKVNGVFCDILKLNIISPIDAHAVDIARSYRRVVFVEEGILSGGIGESFLQKLNEGRFGGEYSIRAVERNCVLQATVPQQLETNGLDSDSLVGLFL